MNTMYTEKFWNVRQFVPELVYQFKNSNYCKNYEKLKFDVQQLTYIEYFYFLNGILSDENLNLRALKIFFSFHYYNFITGETHVKSVKLLKEYHFFENYPDYKSQNIFERLFYLYLLKNKYFPLIDWFSNQIATKLEFAQSQKNIFLEVWNSENEILYNEKSIFEVLIEEFSDKKLSTSQLYNINRLIEEECEIISKLYHDFNDPNYQIVYLLMNDIEDWKINIANNLIDNEDLFEQNKNFYIESLNEFKRRTLQDYIGQKVNVKPFSMIIQNNSFEIWKPDPVRIEKLQNWIEGTFPIFDEVKDLSLIKLIEELPTNNKIILSEKFSQPLLLNILIKFFEAIEVDLTKERRNTLQSFVSNFTTFSTEVHYKKFIEKLPFQEIDFIPNVYFKDFVKIFIILKNEKNNLIQSNITMIRKIIEAIFYNKSKSLGLSYESIRRIKDLQLSNSLADFKIYLRTQLSSLNRDYFLP